jgi:hypothetical protein
MIHMLQHAVWLQHLSLKNRDVLITTLNFILFKQRALSVKLLFSVKRITELVNSL